MLSIKSLEIFSPDLINLKALVVYIILLSLATESLQQKVN